MIDIDQLYKKSNDGLDIILHYYPQARECVDNNKSFKIRDEDDASARIKKFKGVYKVTDFGDEGEAQDPLDIAQKEGGMRFADALFYWAERYGITSNNARPVYEAEWEYRTPLPEEKEGDIIVHEAEVEWTDKDLKLFGPKVTAATLRNQLHWCKVKEIIYIKNGKASIKKPTDIYPIYARRSYYEEGNKLLHFYKIYEPLSTSKQYRFGYAPRGAKPQRYINGLFELRKEYEKYNDSQAGQQEGEGDYKYDKLQAAIICAGERDAACVRARGLFPIWFNSETFDINGAEMKEIAKYVYKIYNIPDIDDTGIRRGTALAKKFWNLYTIWLDESLKLQKDWRGNPKKDFRDYCEWKPSNREFDNILKTAKCAQFWEEWEEKDKKKYGLVSIRIAYFLKLYGFYRYDDELSQSIKPIRMIDNRVQEIKPINIRDFMKYIAEKRFLDEKIRDLLVSSTKMNSSIFEDLSPKQLDFTNHDKHKQLFFFKNANWLVTADKIEETKTQVNVWDKDIIDHNVNLLDDMFTIYAKKDKYGELTWDIEVKNNGSCYFNYIINTSRIYWREELEERLLSTKNNDEILAYKEAHKFSIDGPLLTPAEIQEQKQNLVNKIFTVGYLLHRYKGDSTAWAPFLMDGKVGEDGECNGRSGKSFYLKALTNILKYKRIDGRSNPKDDNFLFDGVNQSTHLVYFDDASRDFPIKRFYSLITSDFHVNPKGNTAFSIPYDDAPKLAFTTNYIPYDFDASTVARLLFVVFSDYYHERTMTNGYRQDRSIYDDFNKEIMKKGKEYSAEEWNLDFNFMAQCLKFYLKVMREYNCKIYPPMGNILKRKYVEDMGGEDFLSWAYTYFAPGSENLDRNIDKNVPFRAFKNSVDNTIDWKPNRFMKALQGFVGYCDYIHEMNPEDVVGKNGRIQEWINGKNVTCIHIRSKKRFMEMQQAEINNDYEF